MIKTSKKRVRHVIHTYEFRISGTVSGYEHRDRRGITHSKHFLEVCQKSMHLFEEPPKFFERFLGILVQNLNVF